jgi:hypothetical protein
MQEVASYSDDNWRYTKESLVFNEFYWLNISGVEFMHSKEGHIYFRRGELLCMVPSDVDEPCFTLALCDVQSYLCNWSLDDKGE